MFTLEEAASLGRCQCCDSVLKTAPEYECSEWFLRCVSCGAKNLFVLTLRFIGWRPVEDDLGHLKACSLSCDLRSYQSQVKALDSQVLPKRPGQWP